MMIRIIFTALALALVLYLKLAVNLPQWIETATRHTEEPAIGRG